MWDFVARQLLKQAGKEIGNSFFNDEANEPEVYADRIKRDFRLHDYADAWSLYDSDRAYWENYYHPRPNGLASNNELIRDSAAAARVPSRNNVFEYGFPESKSAQPSIGEAPPVRTLSHPAWYNEFVRDSAAAASIPSRNNVFEYGFPDSNPTRPSLGGLAGIAALTRVDASTPGWLVSSPQMAPGGANIGQLRSSVFANGAPAVPFMANPLQEKPGGFLGMMAEAGLTDPSNPDRPLPSGLLGLMQDYLRNNNN